MADDRLRALLLIAAIGAALVLLDLLGTAAALAGLGLMIVATLLSASAAPSTAAAGRADVNWWSLLAAGTALTAIGIPLGLGIEVLGGLLTAIGGALVVVAAALGWP